MKCIILAAGYATRLYPLTENFPKPLLKVQDKSILEWLLEDLQTLPQLDQVIIVSNHKFYSSFMEWNRQLHFSLPITILDDGSTSNEERLGAVKDIAFAIRSLSIQDDILVMAGDNMLDFSMKGFLSFFEEKKAACIMRHYEPSFEKHQRTGVAVIDTDDKVLSMQEKPASPQSHWAVPPFYIYPKQDLPLILKGISSGECGTDAPGSFVSWLCRVTDVYAYPMPGCRYDIGDLQSYRQIQEIYQNCKE